MLKSFKKDEKREEINASGRLFRLGRFTVKGIDYRGTAKVTPVFLGL